MAESSATAIPEVQPGQSGATGQKKTKTQGTAGTKDAGGPEGGQSSQEHTGQPAMKEGPKGQSGDRGQRKAKAQGTAGTKDAGGPEGGQSSQEQAGQAAMKEGDMTGAGKGLSTADGRITVDFKSGSNSWRAEKSPLTYEQWERLFNSENLSKKLKVMFGAKCKKEGNAITVTNERPLDDQDPKWADHVLQELKEMSLKICSAELVISIQDFESFEDQWKKEELSKTDFVTCVYERSTSQCTMTILSEEEKVLRLAAERANSILGTLEQSVILVPWPYFDEHCFQHFIPPGKFSTVSVLFERKDVGTHEIKVTGPCSDRERVSTKISSLVATLKMVQMNWPEAGLWVSRTENRKYLRKYMEENHPSIFPAFGDESLFLLGRQGDVEEAQPLLQKMFCTGIFTLNMRIWKSLKQSAEAEDGEEACFIPRYHLLASYDPSTGQLKLVGPLGCHTGLLQKEVKICLKKPAPELEAALQNENVKNLVFTTTNADYLVIEGCAARVQEALQLITPAITKAESLGSWKNPLQAKEISKDRLMTLLLMKAVKTEVDSHLSLPGKDLADVTWGVDEVARHLQVLGTDKKGRERAEREMKSLFVEGETILKDMDEAAAERLCDRWPKLVRDLHKYDECCIATFDPDTKLVFLASLKDRFDTTSKRMRDLMQVYQKDQVVHLSRAQYKYLMKECKEEVKAVQHEVERNKGTFIIQPVHGGDDDEWQISMTGSPDVVSAAITKLCQLRKNIHTEVTDAAVSSLTSTEEGMELVSRLEEKNKCYIDLPEPPVGKHGNLSGSGEVNLTGGTKVSLQHGPLRAEGVDLVALPVPVDLENKTGKIQVPEEYFNIHPDLRSHVPLLHGNLRKSNGKVLLVTPPSTLSCRKAALMAIPDKWCDGKKREKDFVRSAVIELMGKMVKEQLSSVAFESPIWLPEKTAEKQILAGLSEFFMEDANKAASPSGIKTVRLFTRRQSDPSHLLKGAFGEHSISAPRKIVVSGADEMGVKKVALELSQFKPSPPEASKKSVAREGVQRRMQNCHEKDISADHQWLTSKVCTSAEDCIFEEAESMMWKLVGCSLSNKAGKLHLHYPTEKKDMAFAVCQQFDKLVSVAVSGVPSLPSSTTLQSEYEYEECLVNAARKFFPTMLQNVGTTKKENGKVVLTPALSRVDHDLILSLLQSDVQVQYDEREKAKTIQMVFLKDQDVYVEYLPSKKVVAAVLRKYDLMQQVTQRIKIHLGQMKTAVRGRRQFSTQPGESDPDTKEAIADAATEATKEAVEETTIGDNITLPGGLVVIPYRADITKLRVDAIVNAANGHLGHGGGVAKAIADAAGPELDQECQDQIDLSGPIPVSGVCTTGPGRLPCTRVIHAVGPRWNSRTPELCRQQLYDTVLNCCREADKWELGEISIPPISSGIFGMPKEECTEMYCKALLDFDQQPNKKLKTVHFVDIKDDMPLALLKALKKAIGQGHQRTRPSETVVDTSQGCVICTDKDFDQPVKLNDCNHVFCKACIEQWFQNKPTCPNCNKVYGVITGTMPPGTMNVTKKSYIHLPGFEKCGCIEICYSFHDGFQKAEHPNPGQPYRGARRTAYLPDNAEGNKVLGLLREAWNRKLTFTIGRSTTTGRDNVVTWNDIHHKTSPDPGHSFGYPDPDYLTRVQEELAARGVTEESIKLSKSGSAQDFSQFYTPLVPPRSSQK